MGIFSKKTQDEIDAAKVEHLAKSEGKARMKAAKKGFDVTGAIYVLEAMYPKDDKSSANLNMPLVAIFPDKVVQTRKGILSSSLEEIPLKNISSVEITSGLLPTVNVYTSGNTLTFRTDVIDGPHFVQVLRGLLDARGTGAAPQHFSEAGELEKFASLLERGLITQEEFDLKKKQILGL